MFQLADVVEAREGSLLEHWAEHMRRAPDWERLPLAEWLSPPREVLRALVTRLRAPPDGETPPPLVFGGVGRAHGARRFPHGLGPDCLMREYEALRAVLRGLVEREGPGGSRGALHALLDGLSTALAEAVGEQGRLELERARAESARLASYFDLMPSFLTHLAGPEHVFTRVNASCQRLLGERPLLGRTAREAVPELIGEVVLEMLDRVYATGEAFTATEVELPLRHAGTSSPRIVSFIYQPTRGPGGQVEGILVHGADVTDVVRARREAEAERDRLLTQAIHLRALAERDRSRLHALYMRVPVAIAILRGPELVVELANSLVCQLGGLSQDEVLGRPLLELMPGLREGSFAALLHRVMETGEAFVGTERTVRRVRAEGQAPEDAYFNLTYAPQRAELGEPPGVLIVATEVTREVRARQAAQRLAEEERGLRDFERQLIGIVSHDLRNPLGAILMALHVLRRQGLRDSRVLQSMSLIEQSAERSVRMVHDLLDFTQARLGGGIRIERAPMDIHEVTRAALDELRASFPERRVCLERRGDTLGVWDGDRLAQVVSNLVGNALKYSPPDSPVTVRTVGDAQDVLLEVHNGGPPIPADALSRLFQPLQRAVHESIGHEDRSVGLGLYIVDHIVRSHGGRVQVTSREEEGTTFHVRLPRGV